MNKTIYQDYIKVVIILAIIAYIIMFVYTFFVQDIETMVLESGIVEEVDIVDGIITRTEEVVTLNLTDTLTPLVSSGERVSKGQALAIIENDQIRELENNINKLNEEMGTVAAPTSFNADIKNLDNGIDNLLNKVIKSRGYMSITKIEETKNELNQKLQSKIYKIAEIDTSNTEVEDYITRMNKYKATLKSSQTTIKSIMAGTVVYKLDGYEKVLTTEKISSYTPEMLEEFNIPKGELIGSNKENSFKIVDNLECYITVVLEEKKDIDVDEKVILRFPEIDNTLNVTGTIDYINLTPDGAVITFKINKGIEKIINYRKTKVEIVWDSEEGYKLPKNAIVQEGEKNKIYLYLGRNYIVEKFVEIKKEYNDYVIIDGAEGDRLYLYDSVIVNASNIKLNKMLKY